MAKFTATVPLNLRLPGGFEVSGASGATHRIPDELVEEFTRDHVPAIPGGVTWISQDEMTGKYDKTGGTIDGAATVTGVLQANGRFGVVDIPSNRIPVNIAAEVSAATAGSAGTSNVIGIQLSPRVTGNFSTIGGLDPGFMWGVSNFATLGTSGASASGIVDYTGMVTETAILAANQTATTVRGLHVISAFWGSSASGTVGQMETLRVSPPQRKDGAVAGTATAAYGIYVEAPAGIGSSEFAVFTDGGPSRFKGRLDAGNVSGFEGVFQVYADFTTTAGASIKLDTNTAGGHITQYLSTAGAYVGVHNTSAVVHKLHRDGRVATGGTAFPASPATNDLFYRTDYGGWYYYDGTRWLSETLHSLYLGPASSNLTFPINSAGFPLIGPVPYNTVGTRQDVYVVGWRVISMVATSNTASHYWTIALERYPSATSIASFNTSTHAAGAQTNTTAAIGALLGTSDTRLALNCTKTGTPGSLDAPTFLEYRLVGA